MVSFSHCWKKHAHKVRAQSWVGTSPLHWLALIFVLALSGLPVTSHAEAVAADATPLILERNDDGVYLSTTVNFDLPGVVDDVLRKGIPVHFVAETELFRDRWYWTDKRIAKTSRYMRLAYQPLIRRWKLQVGSAPIGNNGLGVTLSQNFDSLADALTSIQRFSRWRIANASDVESDTRYNIDFSFRLDVAQLPRPFQIGVAGQAEWSIAVSRNQKLPLDFGKTELPKSELPKGDSSKSESTGK
jgi:hypothetical protein